MKFDITKTDPDMITLDLIGDDERGYDFLDNDAILELKNFASDTGVMSIYLDIQPSTVNNAPVLTRFKNGVKKIRETQEGNWDHDDKLRFDATVKHITEWLENEMGEPSGKGIALFVAPGRVLPKKLKVDYELFKAYHLPDAPSDIIEWGETPILRPLLVPKDEHPETGVVLFDREQVRFFLYSMGEIAEYNVGMKNPDPTPLSKSHTWHGYGTHNHEQWQEEHYKRYLRQASIAISKLAKKAGWKWLALMSPDVQEAKHIVDFFSKDMQQKIIGTASLAMNSTLNDVRDTTAPIVTAAEHKEEKETLDKWVNELKRPGGKAVSGVADTVLAAEEYRIWKIIYPADFIQPGWACQSCGGLFADLQEEPIKECPYCVSTDLLEEEDIISEIALQVLQSDGEMEIIRNEEHRKILEDNGIVGGILRY